MKNFILLTLLAFLFSCNEKKGAPGVAAEATDDNMNRGELLTHDFKYTTSFENTADSAMIIEVVINKKKRRFLLDTGAPLCVSKSLQEECGFSTIQKADLKDSNGDSSSIEIISVNELEIGNIKFSNIPALVFDMKAFPFECEHLDGIIGSNLLRLLIVQFDRTKSEISFTDHADSLHLNPADASTLFLSSEQSDPRIAIRYGNHSDTCTFDTGDKSFYIVSTGLMEKMKKDNAGGMHFVAEGTGISSMGLLGKTQLNTHAYLVKFDTAFICGHLFSNVIAEPTNAGRSRIGRGLFTFGLVTMDYPGRKFYFSPGRSLMYDALKSFGINYLEDHGKLIIGTVWENTPADKLGLKPGFQIIQFGNFKPAAEDLCNWSMNFKKETAADQLQLIYLDDKGLKKEGVLPQQYFR